MADPCNNNQYRIRQLLTEEEQTCNVPEYLTNASGGLEVQVGQTMDAEVEMFENDVAKASLTRSAKIPKSVKGNLSFNALLKNSGSLTTEPAVLTELRGCGTASVQTQLLEISNVAGGSFSIGDVVVSASASGVVVFEAQEGKSEIFVTSTDTFVASEGITSGGVSADVDVASLGGYMVAPVSGNFTRHTKRSEEDGFSKEMNGACGTFSIQGNANEPLNAQFTFMGRVPNDRQQLTGAVTGTFAQGEEVTDGAGNVGVVVKAYVDGDAYFIYRMVSGLTAGFPNATAITGSTSGATATTSSVAYKPFGTRPMTTGTTPETGNPPILQHAGLEYEGFTPSVSAFTFDIANEVVVQQDFNAVWGLAPATINAREPVYSIDPLVFNDSDYAIYDKWRAGAIGNGFGLTAGTEKGNRVFIYIDNHQTQNITDGDREGSCIFNIEGMALGLDDAEFYILFC